MEMKTRFSNQITPTNLFGPRSLRIARLLVAGWHASIKLTAGEWQQFLEGGILTITRPATPDLLRFEQKNDRVIRVTGPGKGVAEAMVDEIGRNTRGDYEISFQHSGDDPGKYQATVDLSDLPDLKDRQYAIFKTRSRTYPFVIVFHGNQYPRNPEAPRFFARFVESGAKKGFYNDPRSVRYWLKEPNPFVQDISWERLKGELTNHRMMEGAQLVTTGEFGDEYFDPKTGGLTPYGPQVNRSVGV